MPSEDDSAGTSTEFSSGKAIDVVNLFFDCADFDFDLVVMVKLVVFVGAINKKIQVFLCQKKSNRIRNCSYVLKYV